MKKILVPIDFSPVAKLVVAEAAALARACGARIALIHVVEPSAAVIDYGLVNFDISQITADSEKFASQRLDQWQKRLQSPDLIVDTVRTTGFPVLEIIDQARKLSADYIVMGSHGHTAFYDLLIGSTTSGVLKKAVCPVVIVPSQKKTALKKR